MGRGISARALMQRLDALAAITDEPGRLTRLYLSAAHGQAVRQVETWMREAGLVTRIDPLGTVIGRREGGQSDAPALLLGSHIDTVRDAGRYDGNLGVLAALAAVEEINRRDLKLPFAIEVVAFGDEENVRFPSKLLSSRALAGDVKAAELEVADANGVTVASALPAIGGDARRLAEARRKSKEVLAYLEVHIEQGPVLEAEGLPLGIVTAIAGATRWRVAVTGTAGHAGTVPMTMRSDALQGAAEMALAADGLARATDGLVATVGQFAPEPGAVNVIPGRVRFTVDLRHGEDKVRHAALATLRQQFMAIARRRDLRLAIETFYDAGAVPCDARLRRLLAATLEQIGIKPRELASGAGHDAMALASLCPIAMLFVRCKGGISHNPAESIKAGDAALAVRALVEMIGSLGREVAGVGTAGEKLSHRRPKKGSA